MASTAISISIYGSCVSRDTVDLSTSRGARVSRYVARHSLLSYGTDASRYFPSRLPLESPFQRRQVAADIEGHQLDNFVSEVTHGDLILWDLIDERHGCVRFADGSYVTRSVEMLASPSLRRVLELGRLIAFGTEEHYSMWTHAADQFVHRLRRIGVIDQTVMLAPDWALSTVSGVPTPASWGFSADMANASYGRYYRHVAELGVRQVIVTDTLADEQHRWGLAPFHYANSVYARLWRDATDCDEI
ncbi:MULTISPECIES: DUF6270 domain-containing protein [Tessaracoccus]|uniref:DUF6270 domain-containing protein n=1 Tax=Tessaracoccus TaxID=72763 RepID=UPI000A8C00C7|nr:MULTISPECIES: DUF6270 domain-containing protein [Tessaracoccus]VEP40548.1 hypothetical protein TLA_TLA_01809 [Tessaracoccus lapidicaptus]